MMHTFKTNPMPGSRGLTIAALMISVLWLCGISAQAVTSTKISAGTTPAGESALSADGQYATYIQDSTATGTTRNLFRYNGTLPSSFIANSGTDKPNANPTISADGTYVVSEYREGGFPVIYKLYKSTSGGDSTSFVEMASTIYTNPSIDYTGDIVTYLKYIGGVYYVEVKNSGATTSIGTVGSSTVPVISADGQYVAYGHGGNVYLKLSTSSATVKSFTGDSPAISYTGNRIAYVDGSNVKVYNRTDDAVEFTVAGSAPAISAKNDSTDGNFVAYVSGGNVYIRNLANGTTRNFGTGTNPSVSADGNTVLLETGSAVYIVKNEPPVATAQSVSTAEDTAKGITLAGTDPEGDSLTFTVVSGPAHGQLTGTAPDLTYTPDADYNGADSFTFKVNDGTLDSTTTATVSITVTPVNDDPTANNDSFSVDEDSGANTLDVLANDSIAPDTGETLTITSVTQGTHGAVAITNGGADLSYTPDADYNGADSFTYTISDGNGGTDTATVSITVDPVNDDPTANNDSASVDEDSGANTLDVLANDTCAPDTGETLTITGVTQGTHGAVAITNGGADLTYTPDDDYAGADSFTYTISDGNGGTDTATVSITVTNINDDPTANNDSFSVDEDSGANTLDVLANDTDAPDAGETLTITGVTQGTHGAVAITNGGADLTYTPDGDYNGADSFTYTISDGNGGTDTATVSITVDPVNDDPTANNDSFSVDEDSGANTLDVLANDTDAPDAGETLTITGVTQGAHGAVAITNGGADLTYDPDTDYSGADSFTYTISDGNGGTDTATVSITVDALPRWTVTPSAGAHGSISPDTPQSVKVHHDIEFTATPDTGYLVDKWYVDSVEAQVGGTDFTLEDVTADTAVEVTFKIQTFTVTGSAGAGGSIAPSGASTVDYGGYLFFTATPNTGYGVQKWQLDSVDVQTGGLTYELNNITDDHTVHVLFSEYSAPMLIGLAPNTHVNTGRLSPNILGANFRIGATVQLTKTGQPSITATNVVVTAGGTVITCDFNFSGNATGAWNLVVTNDDGKSATLSNAVTLSLAPPTVASITPNSGINTGTVAITNLAGSGFNNPAVELRKTGETAIPMTGVTLFGPTKITGSFDLTGATTGAWDVVVTNADLQSATLANGFTIGAEPPPAPTGVSPTSVQKPGTKTITVNGTDFDAADATIKLTKSGEADLVLTMTSRSATQLKGTIDITGKAVGLWNVVVTNHPGAGNERSATMTNALAIVEAALTGVTLTTDKAWPQPEGATITLTATKTGTAADVEYQFWVKTLNRLTSLPEYTMLRDYATANTYAWKPAADSYWLYVYAREVGSGLPYQVVSAEVYFKIEVATLTGVTLAVTPTTSPQPAGTLFTLTATKSGTAVDVEYRFIYKFYNTATGKWVDGDIRGYEANNNTCTWTPTVAGNYRLYAMARIVGSSALFDRISTFKAYTITNP